MTTGLRRIAATAATVLVALVLALLLAEAAVRAGALGSTHFPTMVRIANKKGEDIQANTIALLCYPTNYRGYFRIDLRQPEDQEHYLSLGMRNMEKALPDRPFAVEQRYNSEICRGPEFPPRRPGVRRVVVIGDSFNQGWGLREEDQYSVRLEWLLNRAGHGRWEALNASRHNGDFPGLWFQFRAALLLQPDVVVYGMTANDPVKSERLKDPPLETSPLVMVRGGPLVSAEAPQGFLSRHSAIARLAGDRSVGASRERVMLEWYRDLFDEEKNRHGWLETRKYLRKMDDMARERGTRFVVMMWPLLISMDADYPLEANHRNVAEYCRGREIAFLDLLPVLRGRPASSLWVHPVDRHPNDVAQKLVAESLLPLVLED